NSSACRPPTCSTSGWLPPRWGSPLLRSRSTGWRARAGTACWLGCPACPAPPSTGSSSISTGCRSCWPPPSRTCKAWRVWASRVLAASARPFPGSPTHRSPTATRNSHRAARIIRRHAGSATLSSPDPPNGTDLNGPDDSFVAYSYPGERLLHQLGGVALNEAETHLVRGHRDARHRSHRTVPCRCAETSEQLRRAFSCG